MESLHAGVFTVVQRSRSDLGLYVHLHGLVTDGAFEERGDGVRLLPAATPALEAAHGFQWLWDRVLAARPRVSWSVRRA